jgi:hypothetical protein
LALTIGNSPNEKPGTMAGRVKSLKNSWNLQLEKLMLELIAALGREQGKIRDALNVGKLSAKLPQRVS